MKKVFFCWDQRGTRGRREKDALQCVFCVCEANLFFTLLLFHFGINIGFVIPKEEFGEDNLHRGIKYIFGMSIWKIWLICDFFVPGGR